MRQRGVGRLLPAAHPGLPAAPLLDGQGSVERAEVLGAEPEVMQWQVVQTGAAEIVVKTVCRGADKSGLARLKMALLGQSPQNVRIEVQPVASIPLEANGKRRLIIPLSSIDTPGSHRDPELGSMGAVKFLHK